MITSLRRGNLLLAFLLELGMLVAFCYAGWAATGISWLRVVLAIGLPGLAIVLWAMWAAPKAGKRRLKMPALMVFKLVIFVAATTAWWATGQAFIASLYGALVVIIALGMWAFRQY
jgi:Zn-dependent protease with chaperone function